MIIVTTQRLHSRSNVSTLRFNVFIRGNPMLKRGSLFSPDPCMDSVATKQKTNVVYSIPCGDSEKEYLGETKRLFGTRLKEHQKAVFNLVLDSSKAALAEHVCQTNHNIAWKDSKAWHIIASLCALLLQCVSYIICFFEKEKLELDRNRLR